MSKTKETNMDFLEFVRNNEIEISNNRIYKRYYLDNSYADPDCYVYEIQDSHNMVGFDQKFWVKEYDRITEYILVVDYDWTGELRGYKIVKGFEEKEVGFLCRLYGSNGEYYKFQPSFVEDIKKEPNVKEESSSSYSTYSGSSSDSDDRFNLITKIVVYGFVVLSFLGFLIAIFTYS